MVIDEKFKDSDPVKTVETIQRLLAERGIEAEEKWYESNVQNCYSVRVTIKGVEFGANGKGITRELARASGYAELMERMQAGYLMRRYFREDLLVYNDAAEMNPVEFMMNCGQWLKDISGGLSALFDTQIEQSAVMKKCFEANAASTPSICVLPFYNVTDDCMTWFPQKIIQALYNTNGLAAGNSYEEAFVQSFSEIIERNLMVKCFFNDITPPDVPEDYLRQYEKAYEIIQYLRNRGFDLYIKDCSMGCPFPLLAAVAVDKRHHSYHVHMGAHPVFEIALERCLTEMFQGRSVSNFANTSKLFIGNAKERSVSELLAILTKGCGKYSSSFFSGTPSYEFAPAPDRSGMSNCALLKEIVDYVKSLGHKMLVRSVSHLGFTSVRIIIPGMSEALPNNLTDSFPQLGLLNKHRNSITNLSTLDQTKRDELKMLLKHQYRIYEADALDFYKMTGKNVASYSNSLNSFLGRMVFACLEWDNDRETAIKYAEAVLSYAPDWAEKKLTCLTLVNDYLMKGFDLDNAIRELSVFFEDDVLDYIRKVYEEGVNPFAQLIPDCSLTDCENCRFKETCNIKGTEKLIRTVQDAAMNYDNEAAFAQLRELYLSL